MLSITAPRRILHPSSSSRWPLALRVMALGVWAASVPACGDSGSGGAGAAGAAGGGGQGAEGGEGGEGGMIEVPDGCTLITYAGNETLFGINGAGFDFEPSSGGARREVVVVLPNQAVLPALGLVNFADSNPKVKARAIQDAVTDYLNYQPGEMDGPWFDSVSGTINVTAVPDGPTQFKGRIAGILSKVEFREVGPDFQVIPNGACLYLHEATFDLAGYDVACEDAAATTGSCFDGYENFGHDCNPIDNTGCGADEICDFGTGYFECFPALGNEVDLCETCTYVTGGPACKAGMTCDADAGQDGTCYKFCCSDADCGTNGACIPYGYVTNLGVCFQGG